MTLKLSSVHLKSLVVYRHPRASYESSYELFDCILNMFKEPDLVKRSTIYEDLVSLPDIDRSIFTGNRNWKP